MCNCQTCQRGRLFQEFRETLPEDRREFADELYESMCAAEDEVTYYRAIIRGDWPGSVGILRKALLKARSNDPDFSQGQ